MDFQCRIEMFGQLKVIRADQELTRFRTHKIGWILAYLALHREQSVPRERLIDLFWPEMDLDTGRGNLNNALSSLRRQLDLSNTLENGVLVADRQSVRLDPQTVRTDVQDFEEFLHAASRSVPGPQQISFLERATALYRGGLLHGCYEEWAIQEQQRLHGLYADALAHWSEALEKNGEFTNALAVTQRAVQSDVYREEFYRRQMRLQAVLGNPAAALETYRQMERRFEADLGATPSLATRELERQLREDPTAVARISQIPPTTQEQVPPLSAALPADDNASKPIPSAGDVASPESSVSALPLVLTRYFGRTEEQSHLTMMLAGAETRMVTLLGPGGAGKTRLSLEVARQLSPTFAGRVWWVSLADLPDARLLSSALTRALQLSGVGNTDPMESVIARLNEAPCLLVLDNFEHLLRDEASGGAKGDQPLLDTASALVRLLLERAPRLRCLITSRRALRLNGEQEYPLPPLPVPVISSLPAEVLTSPSVALYADRARLSRPDFAITPHNAETVARLCRKLEGMPLAIEMAAAWAKVLPPAKMLERLEERLDALTTLSGRRRDLPARHQSLRATIDWSYDLLDAPQKRLLACLSIFRGGWTLEATEHVCASGPDPQEDVLDLLTSLVDKSLVVYEEIDSDEGRYRLLETIRQYGRDRLEESGEAEEIRARHFAYFRTMAEESWKNIRGPEQVACLNALEREHDNMRAALAWSRTQEGRQHGGTQAEMDLAGRLRPFWDMRNYWREGRERLEAALIRDSGAEPTEVRALALLGAGLIAANMGDYAAARPSYEECFRIRQQLGDTQGIASVTLALGSISRDEWDFAAAHRWYDQSMEAVRAINDSWTLATLLGHMSVLAERENDSAAQQRYTEEALALARQTGDLFKIATLQHNLSCQFMKRQEMVAGYTAMQESLTLLQKVGDRRFVAHVLEQFALGEFIQGRIANGVRFQAAGHRIREEIGAPPSRNKEVNLREARQDLGEEAFVAALAEGAALEQDQAIQEVLESIATFQSGKV